MKSVLSLLLLFLLGSVMRLSTQSTKMPRPTTNSAQVHNTGVSQENSMVSQESSSSNADMEVQSPHCFATIYKSVTTFCATYVYAIYRGAQDGLDCE